MKTSELRPGVDAEVCYAERKVHEAVMNLREIVMHSPTKIRKEIPEAYYELCIALELEDVALAEKDLINTVDVL